MGVVAGTYGLNGFPLPEGREWSVSMLDVPDLLRQARAARRAGADAVVVHLHAGYEYDELPSPEQVAAVERLTRSPLVDLVLGEHAHTVQPITRVNGKWVVYGMGNLVGQQEVTRRDLPRHPGPLHVRRAPDGSIRCPPRGVRPGRLESVSAQPDPGAASRRARPRRPAPRVAAVDGLGRDAARGRLG